jgi:hypothetical protein
MSQGPYEYQGLGTPDEYEPVLDPDDEAERDYQPEALDTIDPGDPTAAEVNPYDTSWSPPDRPPGHGDFGTTLAEERQGESLDDRLAEEEPDVLAEVDAADGDAAERADAAAAAEVDVGDPAIEAALAEAGGDTEFPAPDYGGPDPRAGRLVAPDEGAHPDEESNLIARDVGISGAGASAEEAAVHVIDEP